MAGDSVTRAIFTEIANWLDNELSQDAEQKGQLADDVPCRVIEVVLSTTTARVTATFEVRPDDRIVRVQRLAFRRRT
jgi:hypothetical protein